MSTYNFTVRATDDKGAYADRAFSLDVNDATVSVQYDRIVAVSQQGLHRSVDGNTWVTDTGFTNFTGVAFGNNTWVIWTTGNYRFATGTGMTFGTTNSYTTFPTPPGYGGVTRIEQIKYLNGLWHAIVAFSNTAGSGGGWATYTTSNLGSAWTYVSVITTYGSAPYPYQTQAFTYVPATDTYWVMAQNVLFNRLSTVSAWSTVLNLGGSGSNNYAGTGGTGSFVAQNGFYAVSQGASSQIYTSIDGKNFTVRNPGVIAPFVLYQNGRLLVYPLYSSGSTTVTTITMVQSLNAGKSFSNRITSAYLPQGYANIAVGRNLFASYAGATYMIATGGLVMGSTTTTQGNVPGIWRTTDDFATTPSQVFTTNLNGGIISAIATRDS